jgi:YbbR domain-containing protein
MPFQDPNDPQIHVLRRPHVAERWLRKIFVEDLNTKLLALAITLALWFAVTGQKTPLTIRIAGVQLSFILADGVEIGNDPPGKVDVTLTGSKDTLSQINPMELVATVLVGDLKTGNRVVRLSGDRVTLHLPEGVRIEGFQPATISVRLEPSVERQVDVDVKLDGKVAEGYEVYGVSANPAQVRLRGPAGHVNTIAKAPTESISLDGKRDSFDMSQTAIDIGDQKVALREAVVSVHVDVGERSVERTFNDVRVRLADGSEAQPRVARSVTLSGPPSAFAQLLAGDFKVVVDPNNTNARVELPRAIQDKVKLRSIKPQSFSVAK